MEQYHEIVTGKVSRGTGAKKVKARDKKLIHVGGHFSATKLGEREIKISRTKGANTKTKLKLDTVANVTTKEGVKKAKIIKVLQSNTADYTRQGIITKGTIIETSVGKAIVTSRPGQHGIINAKIVF